MNRLILCLLSFDKLRMIRVSLTNQICRDSLSCDHGCMPCRKHLDRLIFSCMPDAGYMMFHAYGCSFCMLPGFGICMCKGVARCAALFSGTPASSAS